MEENTVIVNEQIQDLSVKHNFWWLIKHSWSILFKHSSWNERISRGEFFASGLTMLLIYMVVLGLMLGAVGGIIGVILSLVIMVGFYYYVLKIIKQRFNDIGLGKKGMYWLLFSFLGMLICVGIIAGLTASLTTAPTSGATTNFALIGLLGVVGFISFVIFARYQIQLQFENGELEENRFGLNPLTRQQNTNKPYIVYGLIFWILYIIAIIIIVAASRISQYGGSQGDINDQINSMMQQEKQMIEDNTR